MRWFLLLFAAWSAMAADIAYTVVDLSGPWKIKPGDDPQWARPDFDDRDWSDFQLPRRELPPAGYSWLRRRVQLPDGVDRMKLVLSLGGVANQYELYVNGQLVPGGPPIMPTRNGYFPRARAFAIGSQAIPSSGPVTIALRTYYRPTGSAMRTLAGVPDHGPYWISDSGRVPTEAGAADVDHQLRFHTPAVLLAAVSWVAGLLAFLLWLGERKHIEFLPLSAMMLLDNYTLLDYVSVLRDWPSGYVGFFFSATAAALVYLAMSLCRRFPVWLQLLAGLQIGHGVLASMYGAGASLSSLGMGSWLGTFGLTYLVTWIALIWFVLRAVRIWGQEAWGRRALFAAVAILLVVFTDQASATGQRNVVFLLGYSWNPFAMAALGLSLAILILMLRELAADRREKQRLVTEVEAARYVQRLLLGTPRFPAPGLTLDAVYEPALEVGGDFYHVLEPEDGSAVLVVGDVSGKGLKAAMLVAVALGALRREQASDPAAILAGLNDALAGHADGGFVTCCCARFDAEGGVRIANAGHPSPYRHSVELEVASGLPLGIVKGVAYEETSFRLGADEQLTFVSDGVVEAANGAGELFGFERTRAAACKSAHVIADAAKAWGQNDDITVVTVRRAA